MLRTFPLLVFCSLLLPAAGAPQSSSHTGEGDTIHIPPRIDWEKIAELPPREGQDRNPGLAGVFAGSHKEFLIIAGGNNYPERPPWSGGTRAVYNDIYVLERKQEPDGLPVFHWTDAGAELSEAVSYGASVSLPEGVLCIGGAAAEAVRDTCFLLSWDRSARKVTTTSWPKLPKPLACHTAVLLKNVVYVLGGTSQGVGGRATASFYALDLAKRNAPDFAWKSMTPWDGPARIFPVAIASLEGDTESLYLCGGRDPGNEPDFLIDLHKFDPLKKEWSVLGDVVDRRGHPGHVMATPAFHVPPHHFVVVGGIDEDVTRLMERNARDLKELDDAERTRRKNFEIRILESFPGYPRTVLGYDAEIGEWNHIGNFPANVPLTNPAVNWESLVIVPGGETGPGRRSPEIWAATVRKKPVVVVEEPAAPNHVPQPSGGKPGKSADPVRHRPQSPERTQSERTNPDLENLPPGEAVEPAPQ